MQPLIQHTLQVENHLYFGDLGGALPPKHLPAKSGLWKVEVVPIPLEDYTGHLLKAVHQDFKEYRSGYRSAQQKAPRPRPLSKVDIDSGYFGLASANLSYLEVNQVFQEVRTGYDLPDIICSAKAIFVNCLEQEYPVFASMVPAPTGFIVVALQIPL